jgi:hypothetical protein
MTYSKTAAKNIGLVALGIAALSIPLALLTRKYLRRRRSKSEGGGTEFHSASIFPAYRSKNRPHHRHGTHLN